MACTDFLGHFNVDYYYGGDDGVRGDTARSEQQRIDATAPVHCRIRYHRLFHYRISGPLPRLQRQEEIPDTPLEYNGRSCHFPLFPSAGDTGVSRK